MKKILVAEDEKALRNVLSDKLIEEGYDVTSVKDGSEALQILKEEKIDLVLLDIMMPETNGVDLAKSIQDLEEINPKPKIIVLSNKDDMETVSKVLTSRAFTYLVKSDSTLDRVIESVRSKLGK